MSANEFSKSTPTVTHCHLSAAEPNSEARFMKYRVSAQKPIAIAALVATVTLSTLAFAQSLKVKGVIISRAGNTMTLKGDTGNVVVMLNDGTDVQQLQGAF